MVAQRIAFLIGNQGFRPEPESGLLPLQGPTNDVVELARLLRDPSRGNFEVHKFLDKPSYEILPSIAESLSRAKRGNLFLIYYSGHGKLDRSGRLCLATADTRQNSLLATSIPARHLSELVEESDCDQIVLLLDCCFSGAVDSGLRGDIGSALHVVEDAHGFYIMTASTAIQAARETEVMPGGAVMGRFTVALVNGIESGAADLERKGKILLSDLRRYLGQVVTGQTPQFFDRRASGDPLISLSPATAVPLQVTGQTPQFFDRRLNGDSSLSPAIAAPLLDAAVLTDFDFEQWHRRYGAVSALSDVLQAGDAAARTAATAALQRRLAQERDYIVRAELELALGLKSVSTLGAPQPVVPRFAPELHSVAPALLARGYTASEISIEIRGDRLNFIRRVKLVSGVNHINQIDGTRMNSNTNIVKCTLGLGPNVQTGAWDLVVTDAIGRTASVPNALTIT